jgi:branched-chain amino acid transport system substrate-binding protein
MMSLSRTAVALAVAALATTGLATPAARAQQISDEVVKIGVLNDQSGLYADLGGPGSVEAARMAVADFGGSVLGKPIELVIADHLNKPDVASGIARQWFDQEKVDMIADVPTSSVALAIQQVTKERNKVVLFSGPGSSDLTGKQCSPNGIHWTFDTYALAHGTGAAVVRQGGDTWFFLIADYAYGHALARDTGEVVKQNGGKIVGEVRHPLSTPDFSSFLLQAQASKAKIVGLANAGGDTISSIKQAAEFGVTSGGQKLAALLLFLSDAHSLGLQTAQGIQFTESFYWDQNDETRAWSKRFFEKMNRMPTMVQAGVYSSVAHYLKAVKDAGTDESGAVLKKMRELPVNDFMTKNARIREDGRLMRDFYLFEIKKPSESKGAWDYYKQLAVIPAEEAARPLAESECPLVKKG